jgi:hypothetical protein
MSLRLDFTEVYAVPGSRSIVDAIDPETGLTLFCQETAEQIRISHPDAVRMSFEAWQAAASEQQRTPIEWLDTTADQYHEMLNVLPPAFWANGLFLVGEPTDHDALTGRPRFSAYRQIGDAYAEASRPVTIAEARELANGGR